MKTVGQIQALFQDGDEHVSADRYPYLRLDGVFGRADKCLDSQMLFDPFEQLDDILPIGRQIQPL